MDDMIKSKLAMNLALMRYKQMLQAEKKAFVIETFLVSLLKDMNKNDIAEYVEITNKMIDENEMYFEKIREQGLKKTDMRRMM